MNSTGPKTDPCGTPLVTSFHSEYSPLSTTLCSLPLSHSSTQFIMVLLIPKAFIFKINLKCGTLSNAFLKSRNNTSNESPASTASAATSTNSNTFVRHDLPLINPCWRPFMRTDYRLKLLIVSLYSSFFLEIIHMHVMNGGNTANDFCF